MPRVWVLVQPKRARRRQIQQRLRPEGPLLYEGLSDPILVRRAKDGDRKALATLCERHEPRVQKLTRHLLRDPEDARDAAQEAFAKVCVAVRRFRGEAQFSTWLHRLTVNVCRDVAARKRSWEPLPDDLRGGELREPNDPTELRACLLELPPEQARIVVLKHALDFSFEEIAAASGMPVGTAKCYAHRARMRLRERLAAREVAA
jgi:RNA polymerase sigma-70 factor (ECF subfamily)